jgi:hypothetical protein
MKILLSIFSICTWLCSAAQENSSYTNLLQSTEEIQLSDSLYIKTTEWQLYRLDSADVIKWFSPTLGLTKNNRLKNRDYFLAGKITSDNYFDLVVLLEEKKRADSTIVQVVNLISFNKEGKYIASLEVAVSGNRKKSIYNTSSWLFKDFKIMKDSKITVNEKSLNDLAIYKINGTGRFILYPNY